jgi:hypothetical protein
MHVNPDQATAWVSLGLAVLLGLPLFLVGGVVLTAVLLLRARGVAPRRPVSRRRGLLVVLVLGTAFALAATAYGQLLNLFVGEPVRGAQGESLLLLFGRGFPGWLGAVWILGTELAPPLIVTTTVARRMSPRDRPTVLIVGGMIAVLPQLTLVLLYLRFTVTRPYGLLRPWSDVILALLHVWFRIRLGNL